MLNKSNYIGVFDSGIGGLTVVKSIIEQMPNESIVYFGDTAHVPYGTRSKEQITEYALQDAEFLKKFDVKSIVIACNTADSIASEAIRERYPDTLIFGVVKPASRAAVTATLNGRIGVIATNATISSGAYEAAISEIDPNISVFGFACPLLVPLVEEGRFHRGDEVIIEVLNEYLEPVKKQNVDTLVLGCTHYPMLTDLIGDIMGPNVKLISSSVCCARELKEKLINDQLDSNNQAPERKFYVSDNASYFENLAKIFMGEKLVTPVILEPSENH